MRRPSQEMEPENEKVNYTEECLGIWQENQYVRKVNVGIKRFPML